MVKSGATTSIGAVAENATATGGTNMVSEGTTLSELWVMSAVIEEVPPGVIWFGDAVVPRMIHGFESSVPVLPANTRVPLVVPEQPVPPAPGPKLQPHQLFSTSMV